MTIVQSNTVVPGNIARIIGEKGLKQKAVAERAGYSTTQFNAMLKGRRIIRPFDLAEIARAMEVGIEELFARKTE